VIGDGGCGAHGMPDARRQPSRLLAWGFPPAPTGLTVASTHPLRRTVSLSSTQVRSAEGHWQDALRARHLGPGGEPGEPPGPEVLPSLWDPQRAPPRPGTGALGSRPPSTVGPSASIVAWFAQFSCAGCGRMPMTPEARFCFFCGQHLPLQMPPLEPPRRGGEEAAPEERRRGSQGDVGQGGGRPPSAMGAGTGRPRSVPLVVGKLRPRRGR